MSVTVDFTALDIKDTLEADKAFKTRQESGLNNVPFTNNSIRSYGIFLDNKRKKVVVVVRARALEESNLYNYATDAGEVFCTTNAGVELL